MSQKFTDEPKPSREQWLRDCKVLLPLECTSFKGTVLQKMFSLKSGHNSMVVYKNKKLCNIFHESGIFLMFSGGFANNPEICKV